MKKHMIPILAAALIFVFSAVASAGTERTLRLATDAALDYPTTQALSRFADLVDEKTGGRITIEIYPSSLLGDEVSYMEQLMIGTVDIAKLSIGTLSGLYEDMQVFSLPFMFRNGDEMWQVLESDVGERIKTGLNAYNIQGIGFTDNGSRCFYTVDPVHTIEDFQNMTIRVQQNRLMMSMIECLDANPVNVAATELYSALQTGVCKGGENNLNTIYTESYYEVAKYIILDNHTTGMDTICVNLDLWNALSAEDQALITQAMDEATAYDREIWNASVEESLQSLMDAGAVIYTPDDEVLDSFREAMAPIYEEYAAEYADWIDSIYEVLGR